MKNSMIYGLAVSMIVTAAVAAPMKAAKAPGKKAVATAKSKAVAAKAKTAATKAAIAETPVTVAPVAAAPAPVVSSPSAGQSASTVAAATQEVKKSKLGMLIIDRADFASDTANRSQTTQAAATLTLRPSYKLTDTTSVAAGIDIDHSFGADEVGPNKSKAKWTPYDAYLMLSKSNLGTLPGGIAAKGNARFYLPTSEGSQDAETLGVLRANLTLTKTWGKISLAYSADPRVYFQKNLSYVKAGETDRYADPNKDAAAEAKEPTGPLKSTATNAYRLTHLVELGFQATEKLSFYSDFGIDHRYFNADPVWDIAAVQKDNLLTETGASYAFNDNFTLILGAEQLGPDLRSPSENNEANAAYREDKTSYFVEADIAF